MPSLDQVLPWVEMRARKHACFLRALGTRVARCLRFRPCRLALTLLRRM